jgi:homopolymeric O-antigen transport system permease protein
MADLASERIAVFSFDAAPTVSKRVAQATDDLVSGARQWWIWSSLAWQDVRLRYRGSLLGPFWLTISMAIMIATLGVLYSTLFKLDIHTYLPFLTLGLLFWALISTIVLDGCNCLMSAETIIRQVRMPFSVHVYRVLYRNVIILGHNFVVFIAVLLIFHVQLDADTLLVVPGLAILLITGCAVSLLLGMVGARFRDLGPIVGSVIQIAMFVTPIFWDPTTLHGRHLWLVNGNPFYAMLEVVRAPLLGHSPSAMSWELAIGTMIVSWIVAFAFFARFRTRIPFWV